MNLFTSIRLFVVLGLLSGCASAQYSAAIDDYQVRAANCVRYYGGTTDHLGSVPKENIVTATHCVNRAEEETLVPVYNQWGYSSAGTYRGQSLMLELAKLRESDKISADMFDLRVKEIFALEEADLRQQDGAKRAASAQAWQNLNNQLLLEQTLEAQRAAAAAQQSAAMQSTMPDTINTHCWQTGRSISCTSR